MTENELISRVLEVTRKTEQELPRFRILGVTKDARTEFADQVGASDDREYRALLRKTFSVILTDSQGFVLLADLLNAAEPILLKYLNTAEIFAEGIDRKVTLLPDRSALALERPAGFPFATLIGPSLRLMNGGEPIAATNIYITGQYVPTLANITGQLIEPFVKVVVSMATGQTPSPTSTQARELKTVAAEK